jgi:hypothetical protein
MPLINCSLLIFSASVYGQTVSGQSENVRISVGKERPAGKPGLAYSDVTLKDENKNQVIEVWEKAKVHFTIRNLGKGPSQNLLIKATVVNANEIKGLNFPEVIRIDSMRPGTEREVAIPMEGTFELSAGIATVAVQIREEFEFDPDEIEVNVLTESFKAPRLQVAKYELKRDENNGTPMWPVILRVELQNKGVGAANDIRLDYFLPEQTKQIDRPAYLLENLSPGETKVIAFRFYIAPALADKEIPVRLRVIERYQKYGAELTMRLRINGQAVSTNK